MKKLKLSAFILILMCYKMTAQISNSNGGPEKAISISYEQLPSLGNLQVQAKSLTFTNVDSLGICTLHYGFTYSNLNLYYKDFDGEEPLNSSLESLHAIGFQVGHQLDLKNNWRLHTVLHPVLFSNIESAISTEDLVINASIGMQKEWIRDNKLKHGLELGLGYGTIFGTPGFFPLLSYHREVSDAFSFKIGFPKTEMHYSLDAKSSFSMVFSKEGFYANNSSLITLNTMNSYKNTKLVYSSLKMNLNYRLKMSEEFSSSLNVGYLPKTDLKVTDAQETEIYNYNSNETISIGVGIKYNF